MKKNQGRENAKLQLRREAIKPLTATDLKDAAGGGMCGTWVACPPKAR